MESLEERRVLYTIFDICRLNLYSELRKYIEKGFDINVKDRIRGRTLVHISSFYGSKECLEILISKGMNINSKDLDGCTPLHLCCWYDSIECLLLLIQNGAEINSKDRYDSTPLHSYTYVGKKESCLILLQNGADLYSSDQNGNSPFQIAKMRGKLFEDYISQWLNFDSIKEPDVL